MTKNRTYSPFILFVVFAFLFLSLTACSQTGTDVPVSEAATRLTTIRITH